MVLYILPDIASRLVEEFVTLHYTAFERGVAFCKFFHQLLESRALKTHFGFGIPLLDATIVFFPRSRGSVDLALLALIL